MASYSASIEWKRNGAEFTDNRYSRAHKWRFDGGVEVPASSSPHVVPTPLSDPGAVDPEEAFVAALSSCHMLFFLSIAAKRGFIVDQYMDHAEGLMDKDEQGRLAMMEVVLHPRVLFAEGAAPSDREYETMHEEAHERCFIANSVRTNVRVDTDVALSST